MAARLAHSRAPQPAKRTGLSARTKRGPMICPAAKAAVIRARSDVGLAGSRSRASCMPAIVTTINVPPTRTALMVSPQSDGIASGMAVPIAMVPCASAQTRLRGHAERNRAATMTEIAAANPNKGQMRPKTSGSSTFCLAMAGRKVPARCNQNQRYRSTARVAVGSGRQRGAEQLLGNPSLCLPHAA